MKLIPTSIQPVTITLYRGIPFDNNYSEHTFLSNKFILRAGIGGVPHNVGSGKESFINIKNNGKYIYPRTTKSGTFNFAFGNGLVTSVVMELTGNEINSNYMKVVSGEDVYYYFITGITQKNEVTYLLNLELDVIMTYTDEFLDNMNSKPVMVERKHCRRILRRRIGLQNKTNINPVCFNQESTFSKLKSNVIRDMTPLEFNDFINSDEDFNGLMSELNWIYFIVGKSEETQTIPISSFYQENNVRYPYMICCIPTKTLEIKGYNGVGTSFFIDALGELDYFTGNPAVQKVIISPFPPFNIATNLFLTGGNDNHYVLEVTQFKTTLTSNLFNFYTGENDTGSFIGGYERYSGHGYLFIVDGLGGKITYSYKPTLFEKYIPSISDTYEVGEYKLQYAPFRDIRMSSYYGNENRINIQYLLLDSRQDEEWGTATFHTIVSSNAETNSYYDYADLNFYDIDAKRGNSSSVAYNFPTGTDAELLFNQTSASQYENSKLMTSISDTIKILGGGAMMFMSGTPLGQVAGAIGVSTGITGEIENQTSRYAKMQDLKNTPNSYNFAGSSYSYDVAISNSSENGSKTLLPYVIEYGVTDIEYAMGAEFMYNYGYEYDAETYFNTEMSHINDGVFNRQLFNYVKIREDITTKVVGDNLPLIVAQKFNEILNAGIKLWTFFDLEFNQSILTNYFQKHTYCNAEMVTENLRSE